MLDLGCGDGTLLAHLRRTRGATGYGIEIDDAGVLASVRNGVNVLQSDLERGLAGFDDGSFDFVILSQTLQAMRHIEEIVRRDAARGPRGDRHLPQLRLLAHRLQILRGRMPVSKTLPYEWYDTPNIHLCTVADFDAFLAERGYDIVERVVSRAEPPDRIRAERARRARDLSISQGLTSATRAGAGRMIAPPATRERLMRRAARVVALCVSAVVLWLAASLATAQPIEVLWLGHATFRFTTVSGKVIVIDPFLKKNPRTPLKYKDLAALGKVDLILVTHGHPDHVGDLAELARISGAPVIANYELANNLVALGSSTRRRRSASTWAAGDAAGPGIKIHMVAAHHSSSIDILTLNPDTTGVSVPGRRRAGRLRHRVRERLSHLRHRRHRRVRRHGVHRPHVQAGPRHRVHRWPLHHGSRARGLRAARADQAEAGHPDALRHVSR